MTTPLLEFDRVCLHAKLGQRRLLEDLSWALYPGDRCALLGPSGAGKTLLLKLCNRLSDPSAGIIRFPGLGDLDAAPARHPVLSLRSQITLLLQESSLLEQTVETAITYPLQLRHLKAAAIQQRLAHWCEQLKLPSDWLIKTEAQLSIGQRQWVALTRALAIEPRVLLLDEPTSALDAGRSDRLVQVLTAYGSGKNGTERQPNLPAVMFTTHQLDFAQALATRVLYLEEGQLIQDLTVEQVDWQTIEAQIKAAERRAAAEWE